MALNANALTTVENVRLQLEIPLASVDADLTAKLENLINAASQAIENFTKRKLVQSIHTEFGDGDRSTLYVTRQWPITQVNELWIDGSSEFTDTSAQLASDQFAIVDDGAAVQLIKGRVFSFGNYNVKVIYQAGFATTPSDLQFACDQYCEWLFRMQERRDIGRSSKSKGDESVSMSQALPEHIQKLLEPYMRVEFANPRSVRTS